MQFAIYPSLLLILAAEEQSHHIHLIFCPPIFSELLPNLRPFHHALL